MLKKLTLAAAAALGLMLPTASQAAYGHFSDDGTTVHVELGNTGDTFTFSATGIAPSMNPIDTTYPSTLPNITMTNDGASPVAWNAYRYIADGKLIAEFDFSVSGGIQTIIYNNFLAQGLASEAAPAGVGVYDHTMILNTAGNYIAFDEWSNTNGFLGDIFITIDSELVPEPASMALLGLGLAVLATARRRRA
jgi:hypothetical protein